MSSSVPKMEAIYSKLYSKYTKLKKEKDSNMDKLNREQEVKFMNYVAAADEMIEYLKSQNDSLREQVNELRSETASMRSAKDEQKIQYQKLLMEENLKNKELSDEIQRLRHLDREDSHPSGDIGENRQMIAIGDSIAEPDAMDSPTVKMTRKRGRQSLVTVQGTATLSPREGPPTGPAQPSMSSYMQTEPACCRRNVDISGDSATDICPGTCIFQDLVQWIVGMKFSTVMENKELCISAVHESSGFSFSLTWITNASKEQEPELVYRVLSLGTFERVAPEWMRDVLMFSTNMCPVFFERVSRVMKLSR